MTWQNEGKILRMWFFIQRDFLKKETESYSTGQTQWQRNSLTLSGNKVFPRYRWRKTNKTRRLRFCEEEKRSKGTNANFDQRTNSAKNNEKCVNPIYIKYFIKNCCWRVDDESRKEEMRRSGMKWRRRSGRKECKNPPCGERERRYVKEK